QTVSWVVMQRSDVLLLGILVGTSAAGLYSPILRVLDAFVLIQNVLGSYYVPAASRLLANAPTMLGDAYLFFTKWTFVLLAPFIAVVTLSPSYIMHLLFGAQYADVAPIVWILLIGYTIQILTGPNGMTLVAGGKTRAIALRSIPALIMNLALNFALIPILGARGAAISTATAYVALNLANSVLVWRFYRISAARWDFALLVLATAGTGGLAYAIARQLASQGPSLVVAGV